MGTPTKAIAAILFVAALAAVLASPVLGARDDETPRVVEEVHATIEISSEGMASIGVYPRRCLRAVASPPGIGLIATGYNRRVEIGTPDTIVERFRGRAPISWSPSGFYLAWGRGQIYDVTPRRTIGGGVRLEQWAWSPIADCLVGINEDNELVVRVASGPTRLLFAPPDRGHLDSFEFSNDGRALGLSLRNGRRWALDLERTRLHRRASTIGGFRLPPPCARLDQLGAVSCSPNGDFVVGEWEDRVFIARRDGSERTLLAPGRYLESYPEWGPAGTGVLFLRKDISSRVGAVWFAPEGGTARPTPFVIEGEGFGYDTFPWFGIVDWNVSPPTVRCGSGFVCFPI